MSRRVSIFILVFDVREGPEMGTGVLFLRVQLEMQEFMQAPGLELFGRWIGSRSWGEGSGGQRCVWDNSVGDPF